MLQIGRNFNSPDYKYGFNGKEKTDEWNGSSGANYDYGFRIYDPRVGRWLAVDPLHIKYPSWSPYNFAMDNPILFVDPAGQDLQS